MRLTKEGLPYHPAKFNPEVLEAIGQVVASTEKRNPAILDPFAGVGLIHTLPYRTYAIEIEQEWAELSAVRGWTHCCDFFEFDPATMLWEYVNDEGELWGEHGPQLFDIVATSITYGNRMADHHDARDLSTRNTYKHSLGRDLTPNNSAAMQWGDEYREFHLRAFARITELIVPDGSFILNTKDHYRKDKLVMLTGWTTETLWDLGWGIKSNKFIPAKGNRQGANGTKRVPGEWVREYVRYETLENSKGTQ